jgi:hypothetical protein
MIFLQSSTTTADHWVWGILQNTPKLDVTTLFLELFIAHSLKEYRIHMILEQYPWHIQQLLGSLILVA